MSRKHKNKIDVSKSLDLMKEGYGLDSKPLNHYQIRVRYENIIFDWYHTTGKMVMIKDGFYTSMGGGYLESEDVALEIKKQIEKIYG